MEDKLKKMNGRQPKKRKTTSNKIKNARRPKQTKNGRRPQKNQKAFIWHTTNQPKST